MKKFCKILFGTISIATLAAGVYYLYKNVINKDSSDDFDDFDDDFDTEEDDTEDSREYVSLNLSPEETSVQNEASEEE